MIAFVAEAPAWEDVDRLRRAVTIACEWFASHEYTGDGLNVLQVLREVSSPTEIAKAKAADARVLADTIRGARRQERKRCAQIVRNRACGFMALPHNAIFTAGLIVEDYSLVEQQIRALSDEEEST